MTGFIRPELAHLAVPISEVRGYPGNPRLGDHARITRSLQQHGQYQPLLVQAVTGYVVKGNNTLACMQALGYQEVAVLRLEVDDDRARALALIDNWTSDEAGYDNPALADLLTGVVDWDQVGWSPENLDQMLAELAGVATDDPGGLDDTLDALPGVTPDPPLPAPSPAARPEPDSGQADAPGASPTEPATTRPTPPPPDAGSPPSSTPTPGSTPAPASPAQVMWTVSLPQADRAEAVRLVDAARGWLGRDLPAGEIVLRGLRTLAVVGDSRHDPTATVRLQALAMAAGHDPLENL